LTLAELAGLEWDEVDLKAGRLTVSKPQARLAPLTPPLAQELESREPQARETVAVATTGSGSALTVDDLAGLIAAAAHDAGMEEAESVDAETLRYTYIAFLVRQGARLSELERVAGPIPPASFLRYRSLSPRGPGVPVSTLERIFPAFRTT
jgi:integrase